MWKIMRIGYKWALRAKSNKNESMESREILESWNERLYDIDWKWELSAIL